MQMLPRTLPENIDDLTVQVALVRPGPDPGRRGASLHRAPQAAARGPVVTRCPTSIPSLEPVLSDTLGAIVFQEQVIQVAMALAGFSAGEAEGLRRAMSRKRSEAALRAYRERFLEGAVERGVDAELAERVFEQILGFSGFGFPKAHAARSGCSPTSRRGCGSTTGPSSCARCSTSSRWASIRPTRWCTRRSGGGSWCSGPDVNRSAVECGVEWLQGRRLGVRIGLGYVDGMREQDAEARGRGARARRRLRGRSASWPRGRGSGATRSSGCGLGAMRCDVLAPTRREALWELGAARGRAARGRGHAARAAARGAAAPELREQTPWERLVADYASTGMTLGDHPMALLRPELGRAGRRERGAGSDARRGAGRGRGDGGRAPAPGDGARGDVHAARGRAGARQRDRAAAGLRAPPAWRCGRPSFVLISGHARAPRGGSEPGRGAARGAVAPRHAGGRRPPHRAAAGRETGATRSRRWPTSAR